MQKTHNHNHNNHNIKRWFEATAYFIALCFISAIEAGNIGIALTDITPKEFVKPLAYGIPFLATVFSIATSGKRIQWVASALIMGLYFSSYVGVFQDKYDTLKRETEVNFYPYPPTPEKPSHNCWSIPSDDPARGQCLTKYNDRHASYELAMAKYIEEKKSVDLKNRELKMTPDLLPLYKTIATGIFLVIFLGLSIKVFTTKLADAFKLDTAPIAQPQPTTTTPNKIKRGKRTKYDPQFYVPKIMELKSSGFTNRRIADQLSMSEATVRRLFQSGKKQRPVDNHPEFEFAYAN